MTVWEDIISQYGVPILLSASVALGAQFVSNAKDSVFLEKNIETTKELSQTLKSLEITLSVFQERYPTRDEVERKIKEATSNGS